MTNALIIVNYNNMLCHNQRAAIDAAVTRWQCDYFEINETVMPLPTYHTGAVKLLAFDLCQANRVCLIDADAIIRSDTPNPFNEFADDIFVAVINKQPHLPPFYQYAADQIQPKEINLIGEFYPPIQFDHTRYFNTGFLMANRKLHAKLFKQAFKIFNSVTGLGWWDQSPLNYAVQASGLPLHLADTTWNYCIPPNPLVMEKWIYHYAGIPQRSTILSEVKWQI